VPRILSFLILLLLTFINASSKQLQAMRSYPKAEHAETIPQYRMAGKTLDVIVDRAG
jgi:hypothetical protein